MKNTSKISKALFGGGLFLFLVFVLAGHAKAQETCVEPPSGLVSWWDGDSVSGTNAEDIQDGNDGTMVNGVVIVPGKVGQAFSFDGVNDYISVPDSADQKPPSITIDGWFNLAQAPVSGEFYLVSKYGGAFNGWIIRIGSALRPEFSIHRQVGFQAHASSSDAIPLNTWVYIAGTYDGTTLHIYVDGILRGSATLTGGYTPASTPMKIGMASWFTGGFMPGLADEVEIFNRALSATEIQAIFNAGSAGKCKEAQMLEVAIDIKPQSCPNPLNIKSKGVLPVAILGTPDFDVRMIDITSLRLNDIAPVRSAFEDVTAPSELEPCGCESLDPDSFEDLVLKFDRQAIIATLGEVQNGDEIPLTLTAMLQDGTPLEGSDCVVIKGVK